MSAYRVWLPIGLLAASMLCCNDNSNKDTRTVNLTSTGNIHEVEKALGVKFPEGSRLIGSYREDGMDDYFGAKVEMPRNALPRFLESCPIPKERYFEGEGGLLGTDKDGFWDPNKQPKLRTGQAQLPGARALNVGYDDSSADIAVVYVVNHGT